MNKATAVVLDRDKNGREDIRMCLSRCGVMAICFEDEWICLENIFHLRPDFVVFRPTSNEMAIRFVNIAKITQETLPVIVLGKSCSNGFWIFRPLMATLFFLQLPVDGKSIKMIVESFEKSEAGCKSPVIISGNPNFQRCADHLPLLGKSDDPLLIQGEKGVG